VLLETPEVTEEPDFTNGATKRTEATKKKNYIFFSVFSVSSGAPFVKSGTSEISETPLKPAHQ
jgi:hypothetical protein